MMTKPRRCQAYRYGARCSGRVAFKHVQQVGIASTLKNAPATFEVRFRFALCEDCSKRYDIMKPNKNEAKAPRPLKGYLRTWLVALTP
jgi:hypothetical protein